MQRNSQEDTCAEDLEELKEDLQKCGHTQRVLAEVEPLAVRRSIELDLYGRAPNPTEDKVVFSVKYFKELDSLKKLVNSMRPDIRELCGNTQITFAIRKHPSIGNQVRKNRNLGNRELVSRDGSGIMDQKCGAPGCMTCPLLFTSEDEIIVNGERVFLDFSLNCSDNNIIYIAQCTICREVPITLYETTYFGQTVTAMHIRMNNHRGKFIISGSLAYEKSALALHCFMKHRDKFDMKYFKLGLVTRARPVALDRVEDNHINKYRTRIWGLNRYVIVT